MSLRTDIDAALERLEKPAKEAAGDAHTPWLDGIAFAVKEIRDVLRAPITIYFSHHPPEDGKLSWGWSRPTRDMAERDLTEWGGGWISEYQVDGNSEDAAMMR